MVNYYEIFPMSNYYISSNGGIKIINPQHF